MVFHWSLSDSKYPQVSRTLLSILAVLNNAVVWMVSARPPPSESYSPFNHPLVTVPKAPITIGIIVTLMFHSFFQFPSKVEVLILLFTFFEFYSLDKRYNKVHNFASSLSFVDYYKVCSSDRDQAIRLYAKVSWELVRVIHWDSCWVVHLPFVRMVQFQFLVHISVDHLTHLVVSSLLLLLC